jgi:reactive intermediate/imine deaminase
MAADPGSAPRSIHTPAAPEPVGPYNQAVAAGGLLFCSGQIALDPASGTMVGEGDVEAETRQVLANLEAVLEAAGCTPRQVVRTTVFLADLGDFTKVNADSAGLHAHDPLPTATVATLVNGSYPLAALGTETVSSYTASLSGFAAVAMAALRHATWHGAGAGLHPAPQQPQLHRTSARPDVSANFSASQWPLWHHAGLCLADLPQLANPRHRRPGLGGTAAPRRLSIGRITHPCQSGRTASIQLNDT